MTFTAPFRRRVGAALVLALVVGMGVAAWAQRGGNPNPPGNPNQSQAGPPYGPPSQPNLPPGQPGGPPFDPDDASCDADGVEVGYTASYRSAVPAGFRVSAATVREVALTCEGAMATVELYNTQGGTLLGYGSAEVPAGFEGSVDVPMTQEARAQSVGWVHVELAGGELPVPEECQGMTFDKVIFGTNEDDVLTGTAQRDLIFGLSGDDVIDGGPQADCLVAGEGDNVLYGGPGNDVLIGGPGDDELYGQQGNDTIYSGPGTNVVDGGQGNNTCYVSPQTTRTRCQTVEVVQEWGSP